MVSYSVSPDDVLRRSRTIAVVGASRNQEKEAFTVPLYLKDHGYSIIPVNPTADVVHDLKVYHSLAEIPPDLASEIDVVEVFRPSEELPEIARHVVEMKKKTKKSPVFWSQLGLESEEAKQILKESGIPYVMDICMRTQHQSLGVK